MKTLKGSILNRSSHGVKGFEAQRREVIEKWLDKYGVEKYTINGDFTIDVNDDVDLSVIDLKEFPEYIQFGVIDGNFNCECNHLISLRGAPRETKGGFYCSLNNLTTLEYAPEKVGRDFDCYRNNLISLKGAPREVRGNFSCAYNHLTSLEGAPEKVGESFDCIFNSIKLTEDDVRKVSRVGGRIKVK